MPAGSRPLFHYPVTPHSRRHQPPELKPYQRYKAYLRDEFIFTCVYCLSRETWYDSHRNLGVDHFDAKSTHPEEETSYANLLYACNYCNGLKHDKFMNEVGHPEKTPYGLHLEIMPNGRVHAKTDPKTGEPSRIGTAILHLIDLNDDYLVEFREKHLLLHDELTAMLGDPEHQARAARLMKLFFGFPRDVRGEEVPDAERLNLTDKEGANEPYCSRKDLADWF